MATITKKYLREIILEELEKLTPAAQKLKDTETAQRYNISTSDKDNIVALQHTEDELGRLSTTSGTSDEDIQITINASKARDILKSKLGRSPTRQEVQNFLSQTPRKVS